MVMARPEQDTYTPLVYSEHRPAQIMSPCDERTPLQEVLSAFAEETELQGRPTRSDRRRLSVVGGITISVLASAALLAVFPLSRSRPAETHMKPPVSLARAAEAAPMLCDGMSACGAYAMKRWKYDPKQLADQVGDMHQLLGVNDDAYAKLVAFWNQAPPQLPSGGVATLDDVGDFMRSLLWGDPFGTGDQVPFVDLTAPANGKVVALTQRQFAYIVANVLMGNDIPEGNGLTAALRRCAGESAASNGYMPVPATADEKIVLPDVKSLRAKLRAGWQWYVHYDLPDSSDAENIAGHDVLAAMDYAEKRGHLGFALAQKRAWMKTLSNPASVDNLQFMGHGKPVIFFSFDPKPDRAKRHEPGQVEELRALLPRAMSLPGDSEGAELEAAQEAEEAEPEPEAAPDEAPSDELAEAGWHLVGAGASCHEGCARLGLACDSDMAHARSDEIDSDKEMDRVVGASGFACKHFRHDFGSAGDVPVVQTGTSECFVSDVGRKRSTWHCGATPGDGGKRRLCRCEKATATKEHVEVEPARRLQEGGERPLDIVLSLMSFLAVLGDELRDGSQGTTLIAAAPDGIPDWRARLKNATLKPPNVVVKVEGHPKFSDEKDFMAGGIHHQALTDIAGGVVGGGAQLCALANTQDESLVQFYSEVLAFSFFLRGDAALPAPAMLPVPMTIFGARRYLNSITGQSSGYACGEIPAEDWLNTDVGVEALEVNFGDRTVQVASTSFVAVQSACSGVEAGGKCDLSSFVNNKCDAQRRHLDTDINLWLQAFDPTSYNPAVQPVLRAAVHRIGTGPWGAGDWHGDGQQYFLAVWLATALLGPDGPTLDYYVYSRFCENPGNQCFVLDHGSCIPCIKALGLPQQVQPLDEDDCGKQDIWGMVDAFQWQPVQRLYDALNGVGPPPKQVFDLIAPK